jgi:hypothetical protein
LINDNIIYCPYIFQGKINRRPHIGEQHTLLY